MARVTELAVCWLGYGCWQAGVDQGERRKLTAVAALIYAGESQTQVLRCVQDDNSFLVRAQWAF
jgi:hypothetical protein